MSNYKSLAAGVATVAIVSAQCNVNQYYSPNQATCVNKKMDGEYCNSVQSCMNGLECHENHCDLQECGHHDDIQAPPAASVHDWSAVASTPFGHGSIKSNCPPGYLDTGEPVGSTVQQIADAIPQCRAFELTNEAFSWTWDVSPFELIRPDGSVVPLCHTEGPINFIRYRVQDDNPAYSDDYLGSFAEQEIGGGFVPCDGGSEAVAITYIRVTTATDYWAKNFGFTCFSELDESGQCSYHRFWNRGENKFTAAVWNTGGAPMAEGTAVRITEHFDFTHVPDSIWYRAKMNGKGLGESEEGKWYEGFSFSVPTHDAKTVPTDHVTSHQIEFDFASVLTNHFGLDNAFTFYGLGAKYLARREVMYSGKKLSATLVIPASGLQPFQAYNHIAWHQVHPVHNNRFTDGTHFNPVEVRSASPDISSDYVSRIVAK